MQDMEKTGPVTKESRLKTLRYLPPNSDIVEIDAYLWKVNTYFGIFWKRVYLFLRNIMHIFSAY